MIYIWLQINLQDCSSLSPMWRQSVFICLSFFCVCGNGVLALGEFPTWGFLAQAMTWWCMIWYVLLYLCEWISGQMKEACVVSCAKKQTKTKQKQDKLRPATTQDFSEPLNLFKRGLHSLTLRPRLYSQKTAWTLMRLFIWLDKNKTIIKNEDEKSNC